MKRENVPFIGFKVIFIVPILMLCIGNKKTMAQAVDNHIDQSALKHKHPLSFTKHNSVSITEGKISRIVKLGNYFLGNCDGTDKPDQDVACQVKFEKSGNLATFSAGADAMGVISTKEELETVLKESSGRVKIVNLIKYCGKVGSFGGCAYTPGTSMVLANSSIGSEDYYGIALVHEFGHNQGLDHRSVDDINEIMNATVDPSKLRRVNQAECKSFHVGGDDDGPNRKVGIGFVIDDTGSMSEEIGGVRNVLTRYLNSSFFDPKGCNYVFQLTTFKDNVTVRQPTSDLKTIKDQVSKLYAAGGGDCPEAGASALKAIKDNIKDDGIVYLVTDASTPITKTELTNLANELKSRGVRASIQLSGDCFAFSTSKKSILEEDGDNDYLFSSNEDEFQSFNSLSDEPLLSAIEAYSYLAEFTNGIFNFIPEVNSGNSDDEKRYESVLFNILKGTNSPSIASVDPWKGPRNSKLKIRLKGINTFFDSTTTVAFSDSNIIAEEVVVINGQELEATIDIGGDALEGFVDVKVKTYFDGIPNIAEGIEIFQVTKENNNPKILSISPKTGGQGEAINVIISGNKTNFTDSSKIDMGEGIVATMVKAIDSETLSARLEIENGAEIGFRDVKVITGKEIATEDLHGPFIVLLRDDPCKNPPTVSISSFRDSCQGGAFILKAESATGNLSFLWNTGEISEKIKVNYPNVYSVEVVDSNNCVGTDSINLEFDISKLKSSYVLLAKNKVRLNKSSVINGAVGTTRKRGKSQLVNYSNVDGQRAFVKSWEITLDGGSNASELIYNPVALTLPDSFDIVHGENDLVVGKNKSILVEDSVFNNIVINKNSVVTFTSGNIVANNLIIKKNVTLVFSKCTNFDVNDKLTLRKLSTISPGVNNVTFNVNNKALIEKGCNVTASINVANGNIITRTSSSESPNVLTGLYTANKIISKPNTLWNWNTNCRNCSPIKNTGQKNTYLVKMDKVLKDVPNLQGKIKDVIQLRAFPSPATEQVALEFVSSKNLEISVN